MAWIGFTLLAALMQSIRTAGQKHIAGELGALATSWARYGFGLPVALLYLVIIAWLYPTDDLHFSLRFWCYVVLASVAQLTATVLLVKVLSMRNFATATIYIKTEALLAAILAAVLFHSQFTVITWLAIALGCLGIMLVSLQNSSIRYLVNAKSTLLGLSAGLCFAITSVYIRQASLLLAAPFLLTAALIFFISMLIQGVLCSVLLHHQNPQSWQQLKRHQKPGWFIGITGALGSIGWYTAFTLQDAAVVKTLGQVDFVITVWITYSFFNEKIQRQEWTGITLVILSILLLLGSH
ncbi:MAG: EamA family transporter [Reinekea sp.]|jgi:drug/metabolite transporter (DMT)-like permease